jgi:hypothetical protein
MIDKETPMKTIVLILGLVAFSLTTAPAFASGCGGGDHTHTTDSSTKKSRHADGLGWVDRNDTHDF